MSQCKNNNTHLYNLITKLSIDRNIVTHTKQNAVLTAHISAIFIYIKKIPSIISTGTNNCRGDNYGMHGSYHAEIDAVRKLSKRNKNKKLMRVHLLIAKTSISHKWGNSKPCIKCLNDLMILPPLYGYEVDNIYYTTDTGILICAKLIDLLNDTEPHVTKCYRHVGYSGKYISFCPSTGIHHH